MTQFSYDGEPRDFSKPVTSQDIAKLSERLSAVGIEAGYVHDVTAHLSRPGKNVIMPGETAHVLHRLEPPQVHFAVGNMALSAPAADIQHTVLSAEQTGLVVLNGNQAAFNKNPDSALLPGAPSTDTEGARLQRFKGEAAWLAHDAVAHYVQAIEQYTPPGE